MIRSRACFLPLLLSALLSSSAIARAVQGEGATKRQPHVLFLFTDDQRADTIAALGNPAIITPNLDSLAKSGFAFRNAYCLGSNSGAVCFPSRNMLLSGKAYFRFQGMAPAAEDTFPAVMKRAGYVTYHHGKAGNTAKAIHKQFDHSRYLNDGKARTCGEPGQEIVHAAIEFFRGVHEGKPLCSYLACATPHDPRVAAETYRKMYDPAKIPLPANYMPLHPFDNGWMTGRDEALAPWPRTEEVVRKHLHDYYSVITGLDHHIGRLLAFLRETGEFENTLIVFSSDHGLSIGSHGLFGKQSVYEDSYKPPLVVSGPGIPRGESRAFVYLQDIFPSVCELVGAEIPAGQDFKSFAPVIKGEQEKIRDTVFLSYLDVQRALRDDRWKLIRYPQINKTQLFDLENDPHEMHDLAGEAEQQPRIERLMEQLAARQKELGDRAPLSSAQPRDPTFTPPSGRK